MGKTTKMTDEERAQYSENWGGARENAGRKKLYEGGRQQLTISLSRAQKEAIKKAAESQNLSVAQYILLKCEV